MIQRVLEAVGSASSPVVATPRKLRSQWREVLSAAPTDRLEVTVDGSTRDLLFAIAARGANPIRFELQMREEAGWRSVFSQVVEPGTGWADQSVALPSTADGAIRLRLVSEEQGEVKAASGSGRARAWWGSLLALRPPSPSEAALPNVILLSLDTLGAPYLSGFDNAPGVSPHIDGFLEGGFSFRRAISQYGNTLVSHASIFSGLYPRHHGAYLGGGFRAPTLVSRLAEGGFLTWAITEGGYVGGGFGFQRGFDVYDDGIPLPVRLSGDAPRTFAAVAAWLERHAPRARFFLFVHTYEVHAPHHLRDAASKQVARQLSPLPLSRGAARQRDIRNHNRGTVTVGQKQLDHLKALYSGEVNYLDRAVEGLLQELARLDLDRDTLVVLTADHGEEFGDKIGHGGSLHNTVLHVPLGFRWPGHVAAGETEDQVQLVDVMPTVLDLIGLPAPGGLDGRTLGPALDGEPGTLEARPAFSELITARGECERLGLPAACRLGRYAVQTGRFKLIASRKPERRVLYDLSADPLETTDVSEQHPAVLAKLGAMLDAYLAGTAREPTEPLTIDKDTLQRLETLGYLN